MSLQAKFGRMAAVLVLAVVALVGRSHAQVLNSGASTSTAAVCPNFVCKLILIHSAANR